MSIVGVNLKAAMIQLALLAGGERQPDPVIIREVEGLRRMLLLYDFDLPEQGVSRKTSQRLVVSRYPGASGGASVQHLGYEEHPLVLRGWFRDSSLGSRDWARFQDAAARALVTGGRQVELTWGSTWTLRGYIREYSGTFTRPQDVEYEITMEVTEANEAIVLALPSAFPPPPSGALLAKLGAALDLAAQAAQAAVAISNAAQAVL